MNINSLSESTYAYIECALWCETDNSTDSGGEPLENNYDISDIDNDSLVRIDQDCRLFQRINRALLDSQDILDDAHQGHNFWITRNGHGTGFWDRGLGKVGDKLTDASRLFGQCYLTVGDDNKLYYYDG